MQVCWHLMQTQNCPKFSIGLCSTVSLFLWFGNVACRFHKWWSSGLHGFFLNCRKVRVRSWELRVNRSHLEKHLEKMKLSLDSKVYSSWPFLLILCSKFLILWHDRRGEPRPWICIWNKVIVAWGLRYTSLGRSSLCHGLSSDSHILLVLCSLVLSCLVCKPVSLSRAETPQVGFKKHFGFLTLFLQWQWARKSQTEQTQRVCVKAQQGVW